MKTSVAGEAGEVKELDVLLQAASEGSEVIQLERSSSTIRLICDKLLGIRNYSRLGSKIGDKDVQKSFLPW